MTDLLTCPFGCGEQAKFIRIEGKLTQLFRCNICTKFFIVNTADVIEEKRTQVYELPKHEGVTPIE